MTCKNAAFAILTWSFFGFNNLFAQVLMPTAADSRDMLSLNGKWKFKYLPGANMGTDSLFYNPQFNVSTWPEIKVPGNWELQGFADPFYGKNMKKGTGLYVTNFNVPSAWKKNPVYIALDGVEFGYSFWVNGKYAGEFASAFNRQVFDISPFVSVGKSNSLAVKVITQPKGYEFDTNDDWSVSGISRNVTLFTLPSIHIRDVVVKTSVISGAAVDITAFVENTDPVHVSGKLSFTGELLDASGKLVKSFNITANAAQPDPASVAFHAKIHVADINLWSAETPYLYTLHLSLKNNGKELQKYTQRVGIREITWSDGVLKLNGFPIKLKGVNHHDFSPVNGRSITEDEMKEDLKLMRQANINFIRTSHYPPADPFLDLCDAMGFYVMNEIPYGFGDQHLKDSSYLPILLQRAKSTIWRDKNHPSIIIWTVGNENPVTEIGLITGRYVKRLDNSRPYCFPQYPSEFESMLKAIPDSLDLLNDHYPTVKDLNNYAPKLDRPFISGEYAHSLGLDFNSMEGIFEAMYANPHMAGGAVWSFSDQGILRKSDKAIPKNEFTFYAWPSRDSIYHTSTNEGADGIVYSNRVPQVDYYQVRKVYTPVKILDDTLHYQPGKTSFTIQLENRYDFTNLSTVKLKWHLYADKVVLDSGTLPLKGVPHQHISTMVHTKLPVNPSANYYYLRLMIEDSSHYQFYEKTFPLQFEKSRSILSQTVAGNIAPASLSANKITSGSYSFEFVKATGNFLLRNITGDTLINSGPFARVGRKATVSEIAARNKKDNKEKHTLWDPFLLTNPQTEVKIFDAHQLLVNYTYKPDTPKNCSISGDIAYRFSDSGYIDVSYQLLPEGKEEALQTGLSFVIPAALTEFRWVGKGPYAAYPGKERLSEFGAHHLNSNDLYFPGNRQQVNCAVFSDAKGTGFILVAEKANITVERSAAGIIVSHNAFVSGHFNKYNWPKELVSFADQKAISGNFSIIPFTAATWPNALKAIFGDIKQVAKPFQPFFHSYDQ